jgi:HD-GYP domain-containing protein (c-di-GMP phosphodiesterase class II)
MVDAAWESSGMSDDVASVRMAEVSIALSLATDLGTGQPLDHALRTCSLSLAVAEALALDDATRSDVFYVALLRFLGCTSDASEVAVIAGGDDVTFNATMAPALMASAGEGMRYFVRHLAEDLPAARRAGRVVRALSDPGWASRSSAGHCEVAARLARRLGLGERVCDALAHAFERWDGKGHPDGLAGHQVPISMRIVAAARDAELFSRHFGWPAAADALARRRGRGYDPTVVDILVADGERWLAGLGADVGAAVLDAEPAPVRTTTDLDAALRAMADFADLKSPWFRSHSPGVARLATAAAAAAGLSSDDAIRLGRAALVHDVGTVGVPAGIWNHPGPLSTEQWERVRLHPYLTERVLRRCEVLAPFADLAAGHHERSDGVGYHRGIADRDLVNGLLGVADAYHAMLENRPYRPALDREAAAAELRAEASRGRFSPVAVNAVLAAAGETGSTAHGPNPAGLTDREVEVLCLIARGRANKQVAAALGISPKTVGRHVEHIYAKAGVSTRAGATLFAMEHGLLARVG